MSRLATQDALSANALERKLARQTVLRRVVPVLMLALALLVWELVVRFNQIPHYIIPAPSLVAETLVKDWHSLMPALWFTVKVTFISLVLAVERLRKVWPLLMSLNTTKR